MVFLRMVGCECVNLGNRSERTDSASEGVMTCGRVMMGRDIVVGAAELKSCKCLSIVLEKSHKNEYLLQQVRGQHQNFCIRPEALNSAQISDSFLQIFW